MKYCKQQSIQEESLSIDMRYLDQPSQKENSWAKQKKRHKTVWTTIDLYKQL